MALEINFLYPDDRYLYQSSVEQINKLLQQLSPLRSIFTEAYLQSLIEHSHLLLARDTIREKKEFTIIGMGILVPQYTSFGFCGSIDAVVVDAAYQGQGFEERIREKLVEKAKMEGMILQDSQK